MLALSASFPASSENRSYGIPQVCLDHPCLTLTTYNSYWLGSTKRHIPTLRTDEQLESIAEMLANTGSDLILLQEVNTQLNSSRSKDHYSTTSYSMLANALEKKGYQLTSGSTGYTQQLVIALKKETISEAHIHELEVDTNFYIDSECKSRNLRRPLAAEFMFQSRKLIVTNLHLKSSYRDPACASRIRQLQLSQLASLLRTKKNQAPETGLIIGGDFNTPDHSSELQRLREEGYQSNFAKEHEAHSLYTWKNSRKKALIDFFMFNRDLEANWTAESLIHTPESLSMDEKSYRDTFSDHLAVTTWFVFPGTTLDNKQSVKTQFYRGNHFHPE